MSLRVTQKVIAKVAGVSVNTVSRALNDKPDVNPETKNKILKLAKEFRYTPNLLAKGLKVGETKSIGVVLSDISNPFFSGVIQGIEDVAQKKSYSIIVCNSNEEYEREERSIRLLIQKRVDGVLITLVEKKTLDISYLKDMNVPFVLIARRIGIPEVSYVVADDVLGGFLATEHLIKRGHKKILCIAGPPYVTTAQDRLAGYRKALCQYGIKFDENLVEFTNAKIEDAYKLIKSLLRRDKLGFTAVATFNDYLALGVIKALYEKGLKVPDDLALVGYDDIEFAALTVVPLTTICMPKYELGKKAVEILSEQLLEKSDFPKPQHIIIKPYLVVRESS